MSNLIYRKLFQWLTKESSPVETPPGDFSRLKHEVRPGDVILVEGRSRISTVIRTITQSAWTHAGLYIGRLQDIDDHTLRKTVAQSRGKKENVRLLIEGIPGKGIVASPLSTYRHHHVRICRPIGLSPNDTELVIAYTIRSLGQAYNVRHLFDLGRFLLPWAILPRRWGSILFRTPTGDPDSGICSSLIAEAFTAVKFPILPVVKMDKNSNGFQLIQRNPHLFSPKDFDYSPYFEIIKYPLFDPNENLPYYRRLPWAGEGVWHQDDGIVSEYTKTVKRKKFLQNFLRKKKKDEPQDETKPIQEDNISKPETD